MESGKASADEKEDGVHRLRDIVVEEVSLVDRAANKRRFLVVKRSEKMADDESEEAEESEEEEAPPAARGKKRRATADKAKASRSTGNGEAEKARRSKEADDEEDDETTKARQGNNGYGEEDEEDAKKAAPQGDDDDETEKATPSTYEDDEDVKPPGKAGKKREGAAPPKSTKRRATAAATSKADDDEDVVLPDTAKKALLGLLTDALEQLTDVVTRIKDAESPDDETDIYVPDELTDELEGVGELLEDVGEQLEGVTEKRSVHKAGAKMSKERLARYEKALELLSGVLKELTDGNGPIGPTAGAAETRVGKRERDPDMKHLIEGISELTRVVKGQEVELARMRKARGISNAISVEGGPRRRDPEEVSWPLDMNRPITRDTTRKSVSFYDDGDEK